MRTLPLLARLVGAALICAAPACAGARHPTAAEDISRALGPPPREWKAAIAFYLEGSTRVEFFDGVRTRVVTTSDGMGEAALGRTPWYRVHLDDNLATVLRVQMQFPGGEAVTADYPLTAQPDAIYGVWIGVSGFDARRIIGAQQPRSYAVPASVQKMPSDSLWIYWGARDRNCWGCST